MPIICFYYRNFLANENLWHEKQFEVWNSIAQTRAAENGVFVFGCSHFDDAIPLAFAYAPDGECLAKIWDANRLVKVEIDFNKYDINYLGKFRRPELYI